MIARVCQTCHIAYDTDKAFQPRTREHTMLKARHANWTLEKRRTSLSATVRRLLGGD